MDKIDCKRISALEGFFTYGQFGDHPEPNIRLSELKNLNLYQVGFWPETLLAVQTQLASLIGIETIPKPGKSIVRADTALLRIEPLKIWVVGKTIPLFETDEGVSLDLSHSRTNVWISGRDATKLLNCFLPVDLRDSSFPVGSIISTAFHHVGVTMWRTQGYYQLFIPRGFALSLWELLLESAAQFGYDVVAHR